MPGKGGKIQKFLKNKKFLNNDSLTITKQKIP